jgi:hypothetical protein
MKLTPETKKRIDNMSYRDMLAMWRFEKIGSEIFQGDSGVYFAERMRALRDENPAEHTAASKAIGW